AGRVERARLADERRAAAAALDRLDQAARAVTRASAELEACTIDDARMGAVRQAERALDAARAASQAQATTLDIALADGAHGRLVLDGQTLNSGRVVVTDNAVLRIEGVGTIRIAPASQGRDRVRADLAGAEDALRRALAAAGCADVAATEAALAGRRQADLAFQAARTVLGGLLAAAGQSPATAIEAAGRRVAELDARLARAGEAGMAEADGDPDAALDAARQAMAAAEDRYGAAHRAMLAPDETMRRAAEDLARLRAEWHAARDGAAQLARDLAAARAAEPDDALAARLAAAHAAAEAAEQALRRIEETRPDGTEALADAAIRRLERTIQDGHARLAALRQEMAAREARIRAAEGDGLDERIAAQERLRAAHAAEEAACRREVAILQCLRDAVAAAERAATGRYLAPLARAIQPALGALFPRAVATVEPDFSISALSRRLDEPFVNLSDGTREQIAVLARLGLADLMRARGRPAMLVLDDALTYADSGRLDRMFDILTEAAGRLQILILTCRTELFTGLGARRLAVEPAG
ncbi:ATP-binding protein, partial [Gluconacetobacter sacchari]|uniref:ATP-binding protein n=1 Tax=Gluconacetobacter sacchari TaxID=92759 RepID=UPI0038CF5EBA